MCAGLFVVFVFFFSSKSSARFTSASSGWKCALAHSPVVCGPTALYALTARARARARQRPRARSLTGDKWFDRASMEAQPELLPNEPAANRHRTRVSRSASERRMSIFVPHFWRYRIFLVFFAPSLFSLPIYAHRGRALVTLRTR